MGNIGTTLITGSIRVHGTDLLIPFLPLVCSALQSCAAIAKLTSYRSNIVRRKSRAVIFECNDFAIPSDPVAQSIIGSRRELHRPRDYQRIWNRATHLRHAASQDCPAFTYSGFASFQGDAAKLSVCFGLHLYDLVMGLHHQAQSARSECRCQQQDRRTRGTAVLPKSAVKTANGTAFFRLSRRGFRTSEKPSQKSPAPTRKLLKTQVVLSPARSSSDRD